MPSPEQVIAASGLIFIVSLCLMKRAYRNGEEPGCAMVMAVISGAALFFSTFYYFDQIIMPSTGQLIIASALIFIASCYLQGKTDSDEEQPGCGCLILLMTLISGAVLLYNLSLL